MNYGKNFGEMQIRKCRKCEGTGRVSGGETHEPAGDTVVWDVPRGTRQQVNDLLKFAVGGSASLRRELADAILAIIGEARCR